MDHFVWCSGYEHASRQEESAPPETDPAVNCNLDVTSKLGVAEVCVEFRIGSKVDVEEMASRWSPLVQVIGVVFVNENRI